MQYKVNKKENGIYEVEVSVDSKEWESTLNSAYEKNKGKYTIPGFRKGHAPRNVIEKNYGKGAFLNEALDDVYYKAYTQVLKEHEDIKPIDAPKLDIKSIDDKGLTIVLTITCLAEFTLAKYKGLTFTKQEANVSDKQVKEEIDKELLRGSRLVETNKPAKNDDIVTLDFNGFIDGKAFDGGSAENYQLKLGSHSFIDTFEDQLIGLSIGDKKDVLVTFPADYHQKDLANKPATFKVEIKNVRERIMPKLDEEFVSNSTEFETVEAYKEGVKARLLKKAEEDAEIEVENDMLDSIIDDTVVTVPDVLVDEEVNRQLNGMSAQMKYQGITLEDYCNYIGKTMDQLKEEIKQHATRNVKGRIVLEKLIQTENLDITQKDIDKKIEELAKNANQKVEDFKKQVNNDTINRLANEMLMKKIVDFLLANNTVVTGAKKEAIAKTTKASTKPATKTTATKTATKSTATKSTTAKTTKTTAKK